MIIAECSTNWAEIHQAKEMVRRAKENGAGLVKFQLFDASKERISPYFDWLTTHELTFDQAKMLFDYGQEIDVEVFFSVFEPEYVEWCEKIGVRKYKIAANFRDEETLAAIYCSGKQLIVSNGDNYEGVPEDTVLYCPPGYPQQEIAMPDFHSAECPYNGFSDHTVGLDTVKVALARGSTIVEKHFVMEPFMDVPDAPWSMTPEDLFELSEWEKLCHEVIN